MIFVNFQELTAKVSKDSRVFGNIANFWKMHAKFLRIQAKERKHVKIEKFGVAFQLFLFYL